VRDDHKCELFLIGSLLLSGKTSFQRGATNQPCSKRKKYID
jgi:hypothetical protein